MNKRLRFKQTIIVIIFTLFTEMFSGVMFQTNTANAATSIPKVAMASLDHYPFREGDKNSFFIATKEYSGQVQYQLFYTNSKTMGTTWALINNESTTNGWTQSIDAKVPMEFDISGLNLKEGDYRFAIRVRRVGVKGTYSNQYGDYDSAYPFSVSVVKNGDINLNGDMLIDKTVYTQGETMKIHGVKDSSIDANYKLHIYDVNNNKWMIGLTGYNDSINYSLSNLPTGRYIIDLWAKNSTSTKTYDGWKLKAIEVKKEQIPSVAIVSLDHYPFVEGDKNSFFVSSKDYVGQVQYQLFYTNSRTMGTRWEVINNDITVDGWTDPVDAQEPISFDISGLNLKQDPYRFAIRVRRVGVKGKYSNQYGDYDSALPFVFSVVKDSSVKLNGDMLLDKTEYAKNDNLVINGVKDAAPSVQYKLHLYDVKNNKWITELTSYGSKIDYDLSNIPEGKYIVDIWAKNSNSTSKYDGWKLKVININSEIKPIVSVDSIEASAFKGDGYTLPKTVLATFEDGTKVNKFVTWDKAADTSKAGVFTFAGTVKGYASKAQMTLNVIDGRGNTSGNTINAGLVAGKDGWVFYSNSSDEGKLYKALENNSNITKVSDDAGLYINVVDDWVYYSNFSYDGDGSIYKIKTDGTQRTKLNNDVSEHLNIKNGWIYYTNASDEYRLYKIRTDGTGRTKLNNDTSLNINLEGEFIYYTNISDANKIYKIKVDGTGRTKLNNDESAFLNVDNGWLYYANMADEYKIYKLKIDGTGRVKISDRSAGFINVNNGWIYYSDLIYYQHLYRMRTDGSGAYLLNSNVSLLINVLNDYVYYVDDVNENMFFRISILSNKMEYFGAEIANIDDIEQTVYFGNDYTFPTEVTAEMMDGSTKKFPIAWDSQELDTYKPDIYNFKGIVEGYDTNINLKITVVGIDHLKEPVREVKVSKNTGEYYIPSNTVLAIMKNGAESYVPIDWDTPKISTDEAGTFTLNGTVKNSSEKVKLNLTIIEIAEIINTSFSKTTVKGVNAIIPSTANVIMSDGSQSYRDITWTPSTIDVNKVGEQVLEGTIKDFDEKLQFTLTVLDYSNNISGKVVAEYGEWVFFENFYDNRVYRINKDGSGKLKINDNKMKIIKIQDGWIYYNGEYIGDTYIATYFYKMRLDGTDKTKLYWYKPDYVEVIGDWIYYFDSGMHKIFKIKNDGTENRTLVLNDWVEDMKIKDGFIYFIGGKDYSGNENRGIYKVKVDGTSKIKLEDSSPEKIDVYGDWIYYMIYGDFYRMKTDGTQKTKLFIPQSDKSISYYDIKGEYIYINESSTLWRLKLDGSEKTIIKDNNFTFNNLRIFDDGFFYTDGRDIYSLNSDGTVNKKLVDDCYSLVDVVDGWVYYVKITDNILLYKVRIDGTEKQVAA